MLGGATHVSLGELARQLGYSTSIDGESFTLRSSQGVLVVFRDSPEVLWRPADAGARGGEISLPRPVSYRGGDWYAPKEALALLGISVAGDELSTATGRTLELRFPAPEIGAGGDRFETVELGPGVHAASLYAHGGAGRDTLSMLLIDAALLSLALPHEQREVDAFMATVERGRPLFFVLTALEEGPWETQVSVEQGGRQADLRYPFHVHVLLGEAGTVGPEKPVSGIILVPDWVNLRAPLTISWNGAVAEFQFRR